VGDPLARPQKERMEERCTRRPHIDQHECPFKRGKARELGEAH
jgi:hypothetical protein